jgi:hypothetical protein
MEGSIDSGANDGQSTFNACKDLSSAPLDSHK